VTAIIHGHPREVLAQLHEIFPKGPFGWPLTPMALGIHHQVVARLAPLAHADEMAVRRALAYRSRGTRYLFELVAEGAMRFDLDGQATGPVSLAHRQAAAAEIRRRRHGRQEVRQSAAPPAPPVAAPAASPTGRPILKLKKTANQGANP
jgi:sRNA-binding protein